MAMASSNRDVPGFVAWQVSSKESQLAGELAAIKHSLKFGSLSLGLGGGPDPPSSLSHSESISSELITLHSHKLPPAIDAVDSVDAVAHEHVPCRLGFGCAHMRHAVERLAQ